MVSIIEIIAVSFSLLCVYLAIKLNKLSWPIGIIGVTAYMFTFYYAKLYADFALQFVYLYQGLYGWWFWAGGKIKVEPPISNITKEQRLNLVRLLPACVIVLYLALQMFTDASAPLFDSIASVVSLWANGFLSKKKIETWYLWIFVNSIYIGLFIYKDLQLSALLYAIFFVMAIFGYRKWKKQMEGQTNV